MCITLWYFRNLNLILKKIPLDKNFSDKNFENKLKSNNIFNWQIERKMKRKYTPELYLNSYEKIKIKILCTLRQNHYDSRKNDCSFFNSFFRAILTCSIVYFWYFIGTYSVFFLQKWVNRCRLFRCFRLFRQVRQRGQ